MVVAKVTPSSSLVFTSSSATAFLLEWTDDCAQVVDSLGLKLSGPLVFRAQIPKAVLENCFGK